MVTIIVAYSVENRVIGNQGTIPWKIPQDMKYFKSVTMGCPCVMGRKTWDSLPDQFRPLPGRLNLVVTRDFRSHLTPPLSTMFLPSVKECIDAASILQKQKEIFIIGGSQIYNSVLEEGLADRVIASEIKGRHDGDTFFPDLPIQGMEVVKSQKVLQRFDEFDIVEYIL